MAQSQHSERPERMLAEPVSRGLKIISTLTRESNVTIKMCKRVGRPVTPFKTLDGIRLPKWSMLGPGKAHGVLP
jgi:hypothetical protein